MTDESLHIAVVDIGSLTNLGWVIEGPTFSDSGADIDVLARALETGPLALGFEAPMFVPYGRDRSELDRARKGEGNRPYSASAGACALTKGLVIAPYILQKIRQHNEATRPTFNWRGSLAKRDLLLFEAFVTHMPSASHVDCARMAVERFRSRLTEKSAFETDVAEPCTMNLLGAMLLRMGWTDDVAVLSEPCLVVRYRGDHVRATV